MIRERWFMFLEYVKPGEGNIFDKSLFACFRILQGGGTQGNMTGQLKPILLK